MIFHLLCLKFYFPSPFFLVDPFHLLYTPPSHSNYHFPHPRISMSSFSSSNNNNINNNKLWHKIMEMMFKATEGYYSYIQFYKSVFEFGNLPQMHPVLSERIFPQDMRCCSEAACAKCRQTWSQGNGHYCRKYIPIPSAWENATSCIQSV